MVDVFFFRCGKDTRVFVEVCEGIVGRYAGPLAGFRLVLSMV